VFIRLTGRTMKVKSVGEDNVKKARKKRGNVIYACWHNRMLLPIYALRNRGVYAMVSRSRDGELISRTMKRLGFRLVRGSSSRGGSLALRDLSKKLENGADAAITPDGPRGPRYRAQMGVIHLAQKSGRPIMPLTYSANRKWVLKSWDRFLLPCPFTKAVLVYGDPIEVAKNSDIEDKRLELERKLTAITEEANTYYSD
jgi:lysophospholipid acyltransferase (LPLAT)-like uncharacterized protein